MYIRGPSQDTHINTHIQMRETGGPKYPGVFRLHRCAVDRRLMVGGKKDRTTSHMWSTAPAQENVRHCLSLSYASIFSQSEKCSLQFGCSLSFECLSRGQNGVIWSALTLKTSYTQTCGREARLCYSQGLSHVISLPFISTPARRSVI